MSQEKGVCLIIGGADGKRAEIDAGAEKSVAEKMELDSPKSIERIIVLFVIRDSRLSE